MNTASRHTRADSPDAPVSSWRLGAPRRAFWGLLIAAIVVALALPLLTLWRVSAAGLEARACIWPAQLRAGATAQILIVMPASAASSVRDGAPNVQIDATMPGMAMPAVEVSDNAPPQRLHGSATFMAPITVSMPGSWVAHITVRALERTVWRDSLTFHVQPGGWSSRPLSSQSAAAHCPATSSVQQGVWATRAQAADMAERVA